MPSPTPEKTPQPGDVVSVEEASTKPPADAVMPEDLSKHEIRVDLSDAEICVGGGDVYVAELVAQLRKEGLAPTEWRRSGNGERERARFRPDGYPIDGCGDTD